MNTDLLIETSASWFETVMLLSWKGALLGLAAWFLLLAFGRRLSPAWRHGIWVLVLLRFCAPDLGAFRWSLSRIVEAPETPVWAEMPAVKAAAAVSEFSMPEVISEMTPVLPKMPSQAVPRDVQAAQVPVSWSSVPWLALGWLAGAGLVLSLMLFFHMKLWLGVRRESREPDAETLNLLRQACDLAGVRRMPRLVESAGCAAPSLFGVLLPAILLPAGLVQRTDAASMRVILLHELAHLQRRDLWTQIFASLAVAIHWFNPVAWATARFLRTEAEMAADEQALKRAEPAAAHRLGEAVLAFATRMPAVWALWMTSATLLGISGCQRDLRRRILALTEVAKGRKAWWSAGLAVFITLAVTGLTRSADEKPAVKAQTTVVEGMVVDEDGKPVEGAHCSLIIEAAVPSFSHASQKSGADGRYRFEEVPHPALLKMSVSHKDLRTVRAEFPSADGKVEKKFTLARTAYISGRVTRKEDGAPVAGALVYLGSETSISSLPFRWDFRGERTDGDGFYRMPNRISKDQAKQLRQKSQLLRVEAAGMASFIGALPLVEDSLNLDAVMEPAEKVRGTLVDAKDQPAGKALIWVVEERASLIKDVTADYVARQARSSTPGSGLSLNKSFTDETGAFELKEVHPLARERVWIFALHHQAGVARIRARDLKPGMRLKLSPWNQVKGRLALPDGKPQAGVEIMLSYTGNNDVTTVSGLSPFSQQARVLTDKEGRFQHDQALPHAELSVRVVGNASPVASLRIGEGGMHELKLETNGKAPAPLSSLRPVKGRLVFPAGFSFLSDRYRITAHVTRRQGGDERLALGYIKPDAQGHFITQPMPPGIYDVVVMIMPADASLTPAHLSSISRATFKLEPGSSHVPFDVKDVVLEAKDFEFKPRKGPALPLPAGPRGVAKVLVVDDAGAPFAGVQVVAQSLLSQNRDMLSIEGKLSAHAPTVTTDAAGRAHMIFTRDLPDGSRVAGVRCHLVTPEGTSSYSSEVVSEGAEVRIQLARAVQLDLEVNGGEKPVRWAAMGSVVVRMDERPTEQGRMRAGMALNEGGLLLVQGSMADGRMLFSPVMKVNAKPGGGMRERITLAPSVMVRGLVKGLPADYDGAGWAVASVEVVRDVPSGKVESGNSPLNWAVWTPVGRDGHFTITGLPPGKLRLSAAGNGWLTRSPNAQGCDWAGEIVAGQAVLEAAFEIERCGEKRVRLLLPDGKPAAGAVCTVSSMGGISTSSRIWHRPRSIPLHFVRAEDAEAYAKYGRESMPGHRSVADAEGWLTLSNQPSVGTNTNVIWKDPVSGETRRDYIKLEGPAKEHEARLGSQ